MVEVSNKHKSITVGVSSNNGNTIVTAKSDTSQYWANQSHTFADQSKEYAQESKHYAELANSYIEGFENVVTNNTNNIIATSNDCINQLNTTKEEAIENITNIKSESIASVEAKGNEIVSVVNEGIAEINSTKTTILNDIEFVADGEKKEIEELAENAKDDIKSTGFYMRDDKLYFINSKGEEEEFKGGVEPETLDQFVAKDSLVEVQTVIETYQNGTSWYRIWSNGWCEQGGSGSHNRDTQLVVSLLKPFATTDYNITTSFQTSSNVTYKEYVLNYSTDSITFWSYGPITKFWWRAEGYIK